jgi:hypothetical protein
MASEPWAFMDRVDGVPCPRCRGDLYLVVTSDSRGGVSFGCSEGHVGDVREYFFSAPTEALRAGVRRVLGDWAEAIDYLSEGARLAESQGFAELAGRLRRRIRSLQARAQVLRECLGQASAALPPPAPAANAG